MLPRGGGSLEHENGPCEGTARLSPLINIGPIFGPFSCFPLAVDIVLNRQSRPNRGPNIIGPNKLAVALHNPSSISLERERESARRQIELHRPGAVFYLFNKMNKAF